MPKMTPGADAAAGGVIAGYEIRRLLGRGGMGDVYLAFDPRLERPVALKVLTTRLVADEEFRARLVQESRLAASLDHPNVVPIYDAGEVDGVLFIAMRYVDGTDLRELLRTEGPLESRRAVTIAQQLAGALDAAHARGLVHRDVKPSNVLIDRAEGREHCYLADFGLSQSVARPVTDGELMGTIDYVAPEQIRGEPVDGRADVYALGCLLYEALTGERPFDRSSDVATIYAHLAEEPAPATASARELPSAIDPVLARAMAKHPEDRYTTCAALLDEARSALGLDEAPTRTVRRRLVTLAVAAAAVVAIGSVAIATTRGSGSPTPSPIGAIVRVDGDDAGERYPVAAVPTHVTATSDDVWFAAGDALWRLDPDGGDPVKVETVGAIHDITALGDTVYVAMQGKTFAEGIVVPYFADGIRGDGLDLRACSLGAHPSIGLWASDCQSMRGVDTGPGRPTIASTTPIPFLTPPATANTRWCICDIAAGEGDVWAVGDAADRRLWRIGRTGGIEATVALPVVPRSIATAPGAVWVSAPLDDVLVKVDTGSNRVVQRLPVGRGPAGIVTDGDSLWVALELDGKVVRLDPATGAVQQEIVVGGRPTELTVADGAVWVAVDEHA